MGKEEKSIGNFVSVSPSARPYEIQFWQAVQNKNYSKKSKVSITNTNKVKK